MIKELSAMLAIIAIVIITAFSVAWVGEVMSCERKAVSFEDREYTILGGCMVKHNGMWVPLENIRWDGED